MELHNGHCLGKKVIVCSILLPLFRSGGILFALVWLGQLVLELDNLPKVYGHRPNIVKLL